ncbi:MAG: ABC transporter substrate-binding protein [Alphaproteobacteria bacterium]
MGQAGRLTIIAAPLIAARLQRAAIRSGLRRLVMAAGVAIIAGHAPGADAQIPPATFCAPAGPLADASTRLIDHFARETGGGFRMRVRNRAVFDVQIRLLLTNRSALCDLVVFPLHWLGALADAGDLENLTDLTNSDGNAVDISGFLPSAQYGYAIHPKGSGTILAVPFSGDALAFAYRRDWFAHADIIAASRDNHQRDLAPPGSQASLLRIAKFFDGRVIDGQSVSGIALPTGDDTDGLAAGVTSLLFAQGVQFADPPGSDAVDGVANSESAARALDKAKALYACCTALRDTADGIDAVDNGQAAMAMGWLSEFAATGWPPIGAVGTPPSIGFFPNPSGIENATVLGGYAIGVAAGSDQKQQAIDFLSWFASEAAQLTWWRLGGLPLHRSVAMNPDFASAGALSAVYLEALASARVIRQDPSGENLISAIDDRLRPFVLDDEGTAQGALDAMVDDWIAELN